MHVYMIQNSVNGKVYIGQHVGEDLGMYLRTNFVKAARGDTGKRLLYRDMRKYEPSVFSIRSLCKPETKYEMNLLEVEYISLFGARDSELGYNLAEGGSG